jgi:hypothetical protein
LVATFTSTYMICFSKLFSTKKIFIFLPNSPPCHREHDPDQSQQGCQG